jgi:succinate dehydrogenase hydrophobic anchor subunit
MWTVHRGVSVQALVMVFLVVHMLNALFIWQMTPDDRMREMCYASFWYAVHLLLLFLIRRAYTDMNSEEKKRQGYTVYA